MDLIACVFVSYNSLFQKGLSFIYEEKWKYLLIELLFLSPCPLCAYAEGFLSFLH
jgi:hypothetical protein